MFKTSDAKHILLDSDVFSRFLLKRDIIHLEGHSSFSARIFYQPHVDGFSVFRTNGESEADIWDTAIVVYTKKPERLGGRFELTKRPYENLGLNIHLNEENSLKHYDIYGFPLLDSDEGGEPLAKGQVLVELAKTIPYVKELQNV